jgi:small subunit ribosomal protein S6
MPARDYEILYIVRPELDEEQLAEAQKSVDKILTDLGGQLKKTDVWGRRKLAYEVRHLREGHYVLTDFDIDPERIPELEASLRISDTVFRHLVTRKPERHVRGKSRQAEAPAAEAEAPAAEAAESEAPAAEAAEESAGATEAAEAVAAEDGEAEPGAEGEDVVLARAGDGDDEESESESPPDEET